MYMLIIDLSRVPSLYELSSIFGFYEPFPNWNFFVTCQCVMNLRTVIYLFVVYKSYCLPILPLGNFGQLTIHIHIKTKDTWGEWGGVGGVGGTSYHSIDHHHCAVLPLGLQADWHSHIFRPLQKDIMYSDSQLIFMIQSVSPCTLCCMACPRLTIVSKRERAVCWNRAGSTFCDKNWCLGIKKGSWDLDDLSFLFLVPSFPVVI